MNRRWAAGAKLTRDTVDTLRALATRYTGDQRDSFVAAQAGRNGVHVRTLERMLAGQTWQHVKGRTLSSNETKKCPMCGKFFGRNWANGRRRSDRFWNQKRTCGSSCATKLAWEEGQFLGRAMPRQSPKVVAKQSFWQWVKRLFWF